MIIRNEVALIVIALGSLVKWGRRLNLGGVLAIARVTSIAHGVGIRRSEVGAVEHVTAQLLLSKLVAIQSIKRNDSRMLLHIH